jgi:hypothetical protein
MLIFFSMKIAKMERKIKEMAQQVALANASTGNREGER